MGVKQGRAKGNKQKAEYRNLEGRHERSGRRERGKRRSESFRRAPGKPLRGGTGKNGTEEAEGPVAGSGTEADERKRKRSGKY